MVLQQPDNSFRGLLPKPPTLLSDSHITPQHWQLRDLLHIDGTSAHYRQAYDRAHNNGSLLASSHIKLRKREAVQSAYFVRDQDVYCTAPERDILDGQHRIHERRTLQGNFMIHSIGVGHGYLATGGGFGELTVLDQATGAVSTSCLPGSINNALHIASHDSLPNSHPSKVRLYVSNNDSTIKVLSLSSIRNDTRLNYYEEYGSGSQIRMETPIDSAQPITLAEVKCPAAVNYAAVSPDGKMLAAVDDRNELLLWDIIPGVGTEDEFKFKGSWKTSQDAGFGCDWDASSQKVAVASQDGYVTVFDVRQLPAAANNSDMSNASARDCRIPSFVTSGRRRARHTMAVDGSWGVDERVACAAESSRYHFAQFKTVNAKSSKGAARIVKFSKGASNLLAFAEHRSHAHVVDTRDWQTIQHLRIPQSLSKFPRRDLFASDPLFGENNRRVQFSGSPDPSPASHSRTTTASSTLSNSTSATSFDGEGDECYGTVEEAVRAASLSMQSRMNLDQDPEDVILFEPQEMLAQRIRQLSEDGEMVLGTPPPMHTGNRRSQIGLTNTMEDILRRISQTSEASEERATALSELMEIIGDVESASSRNRVDNASAVDIINAAPAPSRRFRSRPSSQYTQQGNFVHVTTREPISTPTLPSTSLFSPSRMPRSRASPRAETMTSDHLNRSSTNSTGVSPGFTSTGVHNRRTITTTQALYLNPTASTPHPDDILGLAWSLDGDQLIMAGGSDHPYEGSSRLAGAGSGSWKHEANAGIWVWDVDSRSRRMAGILEMR